MVRLLSRQMKLRIAVLFAVVITLGLGASGALGADINIDVRDMHIGDVLRMLGQAADVNIIVGQGVSGEIQSLTLRNVSVETALRLITEAQGYYWRMDDNVYVVSAEPFGAGTSVAPTTYVPEREGPSGQPPEDTTLTTIPRPPVQPVFSAEPSGSVTRPEIITQLLPLSYQSASEVALLCGGGISTSPDAAFARSSNGLSAYASGPQASSEFGPLAARSINRFSGLPQFGQPGGFGAGGGAGGLMPGGGAAGAAGGAGGTITLPGSMEPPVAIMSHNALLVRGTREEIDEFREMLQLLDMPAKQVEIATKWIDVATTASRALGIDWSVTNGALEIFNLGFAPGEAANNGIRYGRGRWWAELAVLENNSQATVINEPRVTCMNGMPGIISFSTEIPYFSATISFNQFGQRTVDYTSDSVSVSNELSVVPQINPDDSVQMLLAPQLQDQVGTVEGPNGERIPIVTTQFVQTMVRVMDGETVVLGGIIRKDESINLRKTPLLADIPIIGKLFQARRTETSNTELLIFVTPKIVRDQATE